MDTLIDYLRDLRHFAGKRLWVGLALTAAGALLEGVGVLALVPLFAIVVGQADAGPAAMALDWFRAIGLATPRAQALALAAGFLVLIAVRGALQWVREIHTRRLGLEFVDSQRQRAFGAVSAAPWLALIEKRRTDIEHAMTVDVSRLSLGTNQLLSGTVQAALIAVQIAIIAIIAPVMLIVALLLLGIVTVIGFPIVRRAGLLGGRSTVAGHNAHHVLGSFMAGQKLSRLHDAQGWFAAQMNRMLGEMRRWQLDFTASQSLVRAGLQWLSALCVVAMLLIGYFALQIDLARLIVVTLVLMRIAAPALSLMQTAQTIANMLPAYANLQRMIEDLAPARARSGRVGAPDAPWLSAKRSITAPMLQADDLWFAYGDADWTLRGASLSVGRGEVLAIDAPSGAGKTTLLDVLSGLLPLQKGMVRVDGCPLNTETQWRAWRQDIAYVPQDPFLFDGTIRENLLWFTPNAQDSEIANALEIAGANRIVDACRDGLDTRVGERGTAFSGGERQRLCLARALLRDCRLLILDEATSAIDEEGGSRIIERLLDRAGRPAILLVSHRADTRALADRTLRLRDGRVAVDPVPQIASAS